MTRSKFDILILGGGHAGVEAAYAASKLVGTVGIVTLEGVPLASAPCNPAIGGVGKGQVVREIEGLGGLMPRLADLAGIQYRRLNESKGFAVQSTRIQVDREKYASYAESEISKLENIQVLRGRAKSIQLVGETFLIEMDPGESVAASKLIVTAGTFLNGKMHTGAEISTGGRVGFPSSPGMKDLFAKVKLAKKRFKTGTPPRLSKATIDFSRLQEQESDPTVINFSLSLQPNSRNLPQLSCYLGRTNKNTHSAAESNLDKSPVFNGQIKGVGPRYCPSFEDKVARYPDRHSHHVFLEPETLDGDHIYPNGLSTSLPLEVQEQLVKSVEGLEEAEILIPGYAVEYDVIDTTYLDKCLEHRDINGLYFAGQVNGTSGYEEAAGQGIVAGYNAALSVLGLPSLILDRRDSYIGVMVEDLVSTERDEPYRLFTARSENRLFLREDNAFIRMWPYFLNLGLFDSHYDRLNTLISEYSVLRNIIKSVRLTPRECQSVVSFLNSENCPHNGYSIDELLRLPNASPVELLSRLLDFSGLSFSVHVVRACAIEVKYSGYIEKSGKSIERAKLLDNKKVAWQRLVDSRNISFECRQRISRIQPLTFGELRRISGIRPATVSLVASQL